MGALAAELATRCLPLRHRPTRGFPPFVAAIVASNAPDLDFAYTAITPGKLGSLLHHRGHTHTLPVALGIGALVAAVVSGWARGRARRASEPHRFVDDVWIWALACFGALSHVAMDYTNGYGVHPFWPWNNRWYYGDAVFIVEPLLWVTLAGTLALACERRLTRYANFAIVFAALTFVWLLPLPVTSALLVTGLALWVVLSGRFLPRPETRVVVCGSFVAAFYVWSFAAREMVGSTVQRALRGEPSLDVHDVLRSPIPATPWCWDVMVTGRRRQGPTEEFVTRKGRVSLAPFLSAPEVCPTRSGEGTAALRPLNEGAQGLSWDAELVVPVDHFDRALENCTFRAFLRFARVPYQLSAERIVGDLRYDFDRDLSFAEFVLPITTACPPWVPPWEPPRGELLEPRTTPR